MLSTRDKTTIAVIPASDAGRTIGHGLGPPRTPCVGTAVASCARHGSAGRSPGPSSGPNSCPSTGPYSACSLRQAGTPLAVSASARPTFAIAGYCPACTAVARPTPPLPTSLCSQGEARQAFVRGTCHQPRRAKPGPMRFAPLFVLPVLGIRPNMTVTFILKIVDQKWPAGYECLLMFFRA